MKKKLLQLGGILFIALILVGASVTPAHAATAQQAAGGSPSIAGAVTSLWNLDFSSFMAEFIATGMNWALTGMGFVLALSGWLLNFSISLTLHIKEFVNATPAIYTTWRAIRDMSGIIIIFLLLYAALQLILGLKSSSFGSLIKNIVVIGLLINFSFFFAGLGIDASNIVSIQIYNAIAPANSLNAASATYANAQNGSFSTIDGGISNIFMSALRMQTIYQSTSGAPLPTTQIIVAGIVGVMIELVAALSFAAAAIAFIFRFVVLLLLLAFSPIWILGIGNAIPGVRDYSARWTKHYGAMLQFMPVYLLLMYLGMSILVSNPNGLFVASAIAGSAWYGPILALGVNAFLVCFMLNMPLVVAAGMGDIATKFIPKSFQADALWKGFGTKVSSQAGTRTIGRAAYAVNNSQAVRSLNAALPAVGGFVSKNLGSVSKAGFGSKKGYDARLKDKAKGEEAQHKMLGTIDKSRYDNKEDLDKAQARAKADQAKFRQNLPWRNALTGKPGGVIGFMVDNRANRQTAGKLVGEAKKEEKKEAKKKAQEKKKANNAKIEALEKQIPALKDPLTTTMGSADRIKEIEAEVEALRQENRSADDDIEAGTEVENEEKDKKVMDKLDEIEKKESGGGDKKDGGH